MSDDLVFAVLLLMAGAFFFGLGAYLIFHQKVYYDPSSSVLTHVEIPLIGKIWTNVPAMALCLLGLYPVYLSSNQMQYRPPNRVAFSGQVTVDRDIAPGSTVIIGLTSLSWSDSRTHTGSEGPFSVQLSVPDDWESYTAYAYATGGGQDIILPDRQGANKEERTFNLNIHKVKSEPSRGTSGSSGGPVP